MPEEITTTPTPSDPATSALVHDIFTSTEQIVQSQMPEPSKVPQGVIPENQNYVPTDTTPSPTPVENEESEPEPENQNPDPDGERKNTEETEGDVEKGKEKKENGENGDSGQKQTPAMAKKFAQMRKDLSSYKTTVKELQDKIAKLEADGAGAEGLDELKAQNEKLSAVVNSFAFTQTEEYQKEVSNPYNKAQDKLMKLAEANGMELTYDALNQIATNPDFDEMDRQEAYEDLARDAGMGDLDVSRFSNYAMLRDRAVQKHLSMSAKAEEYKKEFLEKLGEGKAKPYEVNLDNYTQKYIQDRAKELGLSGEVTEETVKAARHLAHKIDNNAFMDAVLLSKALEEMAELKEQNKSLNAKITKLRGANPSPGAGNPKGAPPPPSKPKLEETLKTAGDVVDAFLSGQI